MFLKTFNDDSRKLQGHPKEVQRAFQGSFKDILRKFQVCSKKVSSAFQEHFKKSFKNVSMKFCFVILFFHGSHCSYPSRRRACFWGLLMSYHHKFFLIKI